MIYNVVLKSKFTNKIFSTLKGFDGRPLRFTDYRFADLAAYDKNTIPFSYWDDYMAWVVVEEKSD